MGVYIEPISFLCMMTERAPAMTPWSTVSLSRFRRALERKICSLSSSTRRSRSRSLTWLAPFCVAAAVGAVLAGAGVGAGGAVGVVAAGVVAGAVAAGLASAGLAGVESAAKAVALSRKPETIPAAIKP